MEIIQTIGTVLFALSGLGFLLLAVFDKPVGDRQSMYRGPETDSGFSIVVAVRLLRVSLAKLKAASAGIRHAGDVPARASRDLEKAA